MFSQLIRIGLISSILCMAGSAYATTFSNGDFSQGTNGTAGWSGQIVDSFDLSVVNLSDPGADSHFVATNDNFLDLKDDTSYFEAILTQTFDLDASLSHAYLSFDYLWQATNTDDSSATVDYVSAQLDTGSGIIDLFNGKTYSELANGGSVGIDISSLIGTSVTLGFVVSDRDYQEFDTLKVGNIVLDVPESPSVLLMLSAVLMLLGLGLRVKK